VMRSADPAVGQLAEEQVRLALELVARLPDGADRSRLELELQNRLWAFHAVGARFQSAEDCARELLEARAVDPPALMVAHHGLGMVAMHQGRLTVARHHLEQALRQASGDDQPVFGLHGPVFLDSCLALVLSLLGKKAAARHACRRGRAIAAEVGHPHTSALTLVFEAWVLALLRDLPLARRAGEEGAAACEEGRYRMWGAAARIIAGWARALQGDGAAGVAEATAALASWEQTGARMLRSFFLGLVGEAHRAAGNSPEALAVFEAALLEGELVGEHLYEAELLRLRGELLVELDPGRIAEAEAALRQAVAVAEAQGARLAGRRARESLERLAARVS